MPHDEYTLKDLEERKAPKFPIAFPGDIKELLLSYFETINKRPSLETKETAEGPKQYLKGGTGHMYSLGESLRLQKRVLKSIEYNDIKGKIKSACSLNKEKFVKGVNDLIEIYDK